MSFINYDLWIQGRGKHKTIHQGTEELSFCFPPEADWFMRPLLSLSSRNSGGDGGLVTSVVSNSATPWTVAHKSTRLPRPWASPGKNPGVGCHCLLQCVKVKSESEAVQSCLTLSDLMDCSLPGSSVQARVLEWAAILTHFKLIRH